MKCFLTLILCPYLVFAYYKESNLTLISQLRGKMDEPDPNLPDEHMTEQNWKSLVAFKMLGNFICNGGLVTDRHVLSVLTCIRRLHGSRNVEVFLGIAFGGEIITICEIKPVSQNREDHHLQIVHLDNPVYSTEHVGPTPVSNDVDLVVRRAIVASSSATSEFTWSHIKTDSRNPIYIYEPISKELEILPVKDLGALLFFREKLVAIGMDTARRSIIEGREAPGLFIRFVKIAPHIAHINSLLPPGMNLIT